MHAKKEDGVSSRGTGERERESERGERKGARNEGHDGALPLGKLLMYFLLGDLVFAHHPREYYRRLTADGVYICIYIAVARRSIVKDGRKRGRESYLEPRI